MSCGCAGSCGFGGTVSATPEVVDNAPGLDRIDYRVARHSSVKEAILRGLSDHELPALARLGARDDADPTIALADGFAAMADALTFYSERIANESFLRPATERLSVIELARLIGYRPDPGVAAEAWLAFTVEEARTLPLQPAAPVRLHAGTQVQSVPGQDELPVTFETVAPIEARAEWNAVPPVRSTIPTQLAGRTSLWLVGTGLRLQPGDVLAFVGAGRAASATATDWQTRTLSSVREDDVLGRTRVAWSGALTATIAVAGASVHAFRLRAPLFGHNAPDPRLLSTNGTSLGDLANLDDGTWNNFGLDTDTLDLDLAYSDVPPGSFVLVRQRQSVRLARITSVSFPSLSRFGLAGKVTRIDLDAAVPDNFRRRNVLVLAHSEAITIAPEPVTTALADDVLELAAVLPVVAGQPLAVSGPEHGAAPGAPVRSEVVQVDDGADTVTVAGGTTTIRITRDLSRDYDRLLTTVNANVAPATEGTTVGEILGSGDATVAGQSFVLKQKPLTWTAAVTGREAALEVRVDGVAWHRVPTLYAAGPQDRVYTLETRDDATSVVRFGDGVEGARLPTGQANVRATYRVGLGSAGNVRTGQLTTLLSRPLGIATVTNPASGSGGEDAEALASARTNAPVTVRTLDRVVSRLDIEDYARAFPGVLKAVAGWVPSGEGRGIVLTAMGPAGAPVDPLVPTHGRLLAALRAASDPRLPVRLLSYTPVPLSLTVRVLPDPDHESKTVLARVREGLLAAYGLEARELGQPTSVDEAVSIVHRTPGVVATTVTLLRRDDAPALVEVQDRVPAHGGGLAPDAGTVTAAEFLTLADGDLDVELMT